MDEFPCVEAICCPLDDLAHGNAATGSDIVDAVRIRFRQQAYEQVCDIRRMNKVPRLPAVGHADGLPALNAASNDEIRRRGSSPGPYGRNTRPQAAEKP